MRYHFDTNFTAPPGGDAASLVLLCVDALKKRKQSFSNLVAFRILPRDFEKYDACKGLPPVVSSGKTDDGVTVVTARHFLTFESKKTYLYTKRTYKREHRDESRLERWDDGTVYHPECKGRWDMNRISERELVCRVCGKRFVSSFKRSFKRKR